MRVIICAIFLTSVIFLNSFQLSMQADRPSEHPVGQPNFAQRVVGRNLDWRNVQANQVVQLPNGNTFTASYNGMIKVSYKDPHGIITINERGVDHKVHPVGKPFLAKQVQNVSVNWRRVQANELVKLSNGGFFRASFDGIIKVIYLNPHGIITVNENGVTHTIHPPAWKGRASSSRQRD